MSNSDKALTEIRRVLKKEDCLLHRHLYYEGKINKIRICLMEMIGFRTFHQWEYDEYVEFI